MVTLQALLSHRWNVPARPFTVLAADGTKIAGTRIGDPSRERSALVLCHGLMGWHRKPRIARFAEELSRWCTVYLPDLRGHGASGGTSSYGVEEIEDVDVVVGLARDEGHVRVATVGTSMGAIAVLRHAGLLGGVDAVVSISSLARWGPHDADPRRAEAWRRMRRVTDTDRGRTWLARYGARLPSTWSSAESPEEVVGKIAPTPVLIVHGRDDHLFGEEEAIRLFEAAGEPKKLLLADRFGHAEDGLTPAVARRIAKELSIGWGRPTPVARSGSGA
ncbi:MAG: alpha/beta fold hydrolase [Actinomycetota bacterium]